MPDERPRGSCVIDGCPRDPCPDESGHRPYVCGPCTSRLGHWLREIPVLCAELESKDAPEEVLAQTVVRETLVGWHAPMALGVQLVAVEALAVFGALPAAVTPGAARGGRVSGSAEPRLPVSVDALDLLAAPRSLRRVAGPDDVGFLPVASTLDFWVQDLRDHRARGEGLPDPSVTVLARWLLDRIDEACDDYPPIDEMFDHIRLAYGALRGQLGLIEVPDYRHRIPCPKCSRLSLVRQAGGDYVVCTECESYLKITEYEEYVMTLATALTVEEREKRRKAAADRRALVRLLREMHAVGWRHRIEHAPSERDPDGAPYHEGYLAHIWTRPGERISAWWRVDPRKPIWSVCLGVVEDDEVYDELVTASVSWIDAYGVKRLHQLASVAGVLSVPRERAA